MRGKNTISLYNDVLEKKDQIIYSGDGVSVIVKKDSKLELSYLFRNVWVKGLLKDNIIDLKINKNHLQTCGLLCLDDEKEELCDLLASSGVVRVTNYDMSRMINGEAHDGVYQLLEYSRMVEFD